MRSFGTMRYIIFMLDVFPVILTNDNSIARASLNAPHSSWLPCCRKAHCISHDDVILKSSLLKWLPAIRNVY